MPTKTKSSAKTKAGQPMTVKKADSNKVKGGFAGKPVE
jgi:hypothetical protein